jgi:hypothetical protein
MAIKVKELKDDALLDVKVNKNYYMMLKNVLAYMFNGQPDGPEKEESFKKIMEGKYPDMNEFERSFYTITLMVAEIEKMATETNQYEEKEILEPGDEGYVEPVIPE